MDINKARNARLKTQLGEREKKKEKGGLLIVIFQHMFNELF
jgi:hypothetical protein